MRMQLVIRRKYQQKETAHKSSGASAGTDCYVVQFLGAGDARRLWALRGYFCTRHSNKHELWSVTAAELIQTSLAAWAQRCTMAVAESSCDLTELNSAIFHVGTWFREEEEEVVVVVGLTSDGALALMAPKCGRFIITACLSYQGTVGNKHSSTDWWILLGA